MKFSDSWVSPQFDGGAAPIERDVLMRPGIAHLWFVVRGSCPGATVCSSTPAPLKFCPNSQFRTPNSAFRIVKKVSLHTRSPTWTPLSWTLVSNSAKKVQNVRPGTASMTWSPYITNPPWRGFVGRNSSRFGKKTLNVLECVPLREQA